MHVKKYVDNDTKSKNESQCLKEQILQLIFWPKLPN